MGATKAAMMDHEMREERKRELASQMYELLEIISNEAWQVPHGVGHKIDAIINDVERP